ncbi:MAG: MGMT family protein [Gracilimonas sp.]|uniref:MGMT family protein n=1 Tax=Gracilimonas sp. TaxID=1974203 RepID=UPI0019C59B8C|nr:MGMT family protein [Gracilimonas sp.]MBD3615685.1 MGMT family protein [Gracilimonas sp.]
MNSESKKDFYTRVYEVVSHIPEGKVTSYGAISRYLGVESGARMVGYAMNNYRSYNLGYELPAHRVLNRLGQLTGRAHFEGDTMRERLLQEGVQFKEEYTVDMKRHFWDPFEINKKG